MTKIKLRDLPKDSQFRTCLTQRPGERIDLITPIEGGIWVELGFPFQRKILHPDVMVFSR